jgi:hypothetical protein
MVDLTAIEAAIVGNLSAIPYLEKVYDHEPKSIPVLPAATLFFDGFRQNDQATRRKSVAWRWVVRLYVRLNDAEKAQQDIKTLIMDARKELAKDPLLGGTCLFHSVQSGEVFVSMQQNNPHMIAELVLEATTEEPY